MTSIAVMTFNIWSDGEAGGQPLSQTAEVIRAAGADLVGLQEASKAAQRIADMLGWHCVTQGGGRAIISRFPLVDVTPGRRGVKVQISDERAAYHFNTHLAPAPYQPYQLLNIAYGDWPFVDGEAQAVAAATAARGAEVAALLEEIAAACAAEHAAGAAGSLQDVSVFVTGDFNEPSHLDWTHAAADAGLHPLKVAYPSTSSFAAAGFVDAYRSKYPDEVAHPGHTWTPTTAADDPADHHDRIDLILHRGRGVTVNDVHIVGEDCDHADKVVSPYPSDHRAVMARYVLSSH